MERCGVECSECMISGSNSSYCSGICRPFTWLIMVVYARFHISVKSSDSRWVFWSKICTLSLWKWEFFKWSDKENKKQNSARVQTASVKGIHEKFNLKKKKKFSAEKHSFFIKQKGCLWASCTIWTLIDQVICTIHNTNKVFRNKFSRILFPHNGLGW